MSYDNTLEALIGKTIVGVDLAEDRGAIRFRLADGGALVYLADGDCCSYTWIEGVDDPAALLGTVVQTENLEMPEGPVSEFHPNTDSVSFYGVKVTTANGRCVIDFRNDSNGYYGGSLEGPYAEDGSWLGGDGYHVFGQNKSAQQWAPLAPR